MGVTINADEIIYSSFCDFTKHEHLTKSLSTDDTEKAKSILNFFFFCTNGLRLLNCNRQVRKVLKLQLLTQIKVLLLSSLLADMLEQVYTETD